MVYLLTEIKFTDTPWLPYQLDPQKDTSKETTIWELVLRKTMGFLMICIDVCSSFVLF